MIRRRPVARAGGLGQLLIHDPVQVLGVRRLNCVSQSSLPIWLTRNTLYRWRARYQAKGLRGLRPRSRRPRRCRRKRWAPELTRRLIQLRQAHPGWGKQKLAVLLHREGHAVSVSTVGRMVSELLRRGRIARSPRRTKRRRASRPRPWAQRGWGGLET